MRFGIVGAGAVGTVIGASLARTHDVRVLVRDAKTSRAIADRGGLLIEDHAVAPAMATHDPRDLADVECLIVAVKTYDTVAALQPLRPTLHAEAAILSIQNGIDAGEQIDFALGHRRAVALGPTTEAGTRLEPGVVRRARPGITQLGWLPGHSGGRVMLFAMRDAFDDAGLVVNTVDDIVPFIWGKLLVNAAINPVTALAGLTNGELLEDPAALADAGAVAREVAGLAAHEGVVLPFADPVGRVAEVAAATAANRSSMLQDLDAGRHTEIDAILGAVVRRAAAFELAVPVASRLYDEVQRRTTA